jgi:transcriptional regulator with XRE-family HTH domain
MPDALRETISRNIRECRMNKYPGRGGGKRCAESFGVSPQQWSPWESGKRTPDELRLEQIATFFNTTVEWFRRDHRQNATTALATTDGGERNAVLRTHVMGTEMTRARSGLFTEGEEEDINHYLWLLELLTRKLTASGLRVVVSFEKQNILTSAS